MFLHKLREYWITIVALVVLTTIGFLFVMFPREENRWHGLLEAIFIAAFLTVTVDPFVKKRLLKEASQDIFHHLIGVDLPIEMRESLKQYVFGMKYYRKTLEVRAQGQREGDGRLRIHIRIEAEVIAVTKADYHQSLAFESSEDPRVIKMEARTATRTSEWAPRSPLVESKMEPMELVARNDPLPLRRGEELKSLFSFNIHGSETDFWVLHFGTTTLRTKVILEPLPNMEMFASDAGCRDPHNPNVYNYDEVFIKGDHLHIRWRPKEMPTAA